jgi:hypothetical protein
LYTLLSNHVLIRFKRIISQNSHNLSNLLTWRLTYLRLGERRAVLGCTGFHVVVSLQWRTLFERASPYAIHSVFGVLFERAPPCSLAMHWLGHLVFGSGRCASRNPPSSPPVFQCTKLLNMSHKVLLMCNLCLVLFVFFSHVAIRAWFWLPFYFP